MNINILLPVLYPFVADSEKFQRSKEDGLVELPAKSVLFPHKKEGGKDQKMAKITL